MSVVGFLHSKVVTNNWAKYCFMPGLNIMVMCECQPSQKKCSNQPTEQGEPYCLNRLDLIDIDFPKYF